MHILRRRGWEMPERLVTPEALVMGRRTALAGAGSLALAAPACAQDGPRAIRNITPGREITRGEIRDDLQQLLRIQREQEPVAVGSDAEAAPWTISLEGQLKQPRTIAIDDLLKQVQLEERIYRHRCVEAWAMTVPWTGFPLSQLLKIAEPLGSAKYVVFETAQDKTMPGLQLAVLSLALHRGAGDRRGGERTGVHLDRAVRQAAAAAERWPDPADHAVEIRLQVGQGARRRSASPTSGRVNFWQAIQPSEYGFWANVNPAVSHPRWSQAQRAAAGQQRDGADANLQRLR